MENIGGKSIALVTGSSRGIGRAIAVQLAEDGFHVVVNYRDNELAAKEVSELISNGGGSSTLCQFDVADKEGVDQAIKSLRKKVGIMSLLVNNAGIIRDQPTVRMKTQDWDAVIETNLTGLHNCTRAVLSTWSGHNMGQSIINISSVLGCRGNAYQANYCAAKAGMIGYTKSLAREFASRGLNINAVAPGVIETDAIAHLSHDGFLKDIPLGRLGSPEEVAFLVSFLASSRARYITGQVFKIDGGWDI